MSRSGIEHAIYINLDRRTDRRELMEQELEVLGISGERFSGLVKPWSASGCAYSHLEVLRIAASRGYSHVLVLEDDFKAVVDPETFRNTVRVVLESGLEYDVLMLSHRIQRSEPVPDHPELLKVLEAQTASGYIVHGNYLQTLISLFEENFPLLEQTRAHWIYANDQIWKRLQPAGRWYAFNPRLGIQRESFSDLAGHVVSYGC
jgi:glycosyl transferase, family 25